jgi:hypothetical protein
VKEVIELDQNRFTLGRTSVFSCELARGEDGDGNHELLNFIRTFAGNHELLNFIFRTFAGKIGVSLSSSSNILRNVGNSPKPAVRIVGTASDNVKEPMLSPIGAPGVTSDPVVHTILERRRFDQKRSKALH